jgi:hypothetical protein
MKSMFVNEHVLDGLLYMAKEAYDSGLEFDDIGPLLDLFGEADATGEEIIVVSRNGEFALEMEID